MQLAGGSNPPCGILDVVLFFRFLLFSSAQFVPGSLLNQITESSLFLQIPTVDCNITGARPESPLLHHHGVWPVQPVAGGTARNARLFNLMTLDVFVGYHDARNDRPTRGGVRFCHIIILS
jgi:hypothetical protein